ncbi:MAG: nucleoid-associated protein [Motiliproteus sp.]
MGLNHLIVHEVTNDAGSTPDTNLRSQSLPVADLKVQKLAGALLEIYRKKPNKTYGGFNPSRKLYPFADWLDSFLTQTERDSAFVTLTQATVQKLAHQMEGTTAKGGYVVFFDYTENTERYLMIVIIMDRSGLTFDYDLNINDVIALDLEHLHQAARVSVSRYLSASDSENYLSFIQGKSSTLRGYFLDTLGCTNSHGSKESTEGAFNALDEVCDRLNLGAAILTSEILNNAL